MPETRIVGIDIDAEPERVRADVIDYGHGAAAMLGTTLRVGCRGRRWSRGPAYCVPHQATIDAIKIAGTLEALVLDPAYSGKGRRADCINSFGAVAER